MPSSVLSPLCAQPSLAASSSLPHRYFLCSLIAAGVVSLFVVMVGSVSQSASALHATSSASRIISLSPGVAFGRSNTIYSIQGAGRIPRQLGAQGLEVENALDEPSATSEPSTSLMRRLPSFLLICLFSSLSVILAIRHGLTTTKQPLQQLAPAAMGFADDTLSMASLSGQFDGDWKAHQQFGRLPPLNGRMADKDFVDVEVHLMNYLTYKSVRIVLSQLVETDLSPMKADYMWLRRFCLENSMADSEAFLKKLIITRPQFADRLLVTRLDVFTQWSKSYGEENMLQRIKDSDLRVRKHQLNEAAKWDFAGKNTPIPDKTVE